GQPDTRKYQRIMQQVGDRLAWLGGIGDDCVPAYFAIGVQAFTSSISNLAPALSLELAPSGPGRGFRHLLRLMRRYVHPLFAIRERSRGYEVAVTKAAMEMLGMPAGPARPPIAQCTEKDLADIRVLMEAYRDFSTPRCQMAAD